MARPTSLHDLTADAGAVFTDAAGWSLPAHYGDVTREYSAARNSAILVDVSHRSKVEVAGPDAPTFLHNLCTNDIASMPLGAGCEAFFCTNRAKVVAHTLIYHVLPAPDRHAFWIDLVPGEAPKFVKHLDRFLISEQVELADQTEAFAQIHLAGPRAASVLTQALADHLPDLDLLQHMERTFGASVTAHIRRWDPLGLPGFDIVCRAERAVGVWRMLQAAGASPAGLDACEILRVEAGMPVYGIDIDENRFAFDIGRTAQAISYAKGCYLGQEPIVMARDRAGHAPRTLIGLTFADATPAPRGCKLRRNGEEVGWITSSLFSPKLNRAIALAYLRYGHHEPGTVVSAEGVGDATVTSLPF